MMRPEQLSLSLGWKFIKTKIGGSIVGLLGKILVTLFLPLRTHFCLTSPPNILLSYSPAPQPIFDLPLWMCSPNSHTPPKKGISHYSLPWKKQKSISKDFDIKSEWIEVRLWISNVTQIYLFYISLAENDMWFKSMTVAKSKKSQKTKSVQFCWTTPWRKNLYLGQIF